MGQIDATGVRGPHEKEFEDISNAKYSLFQKINSETLKKIIQEDIGGRIENIGLNEDWTITLEMFPEVNIHLSYSYFGDEFGDVLVGVDERAKFIQNLIAAEGNGCHLNDLIVVGIKPGGFEINSNVSSRHKVRPVCSLPFVIPIGKKGGDYSTDFLRPWAICDFLSTFS